MMVQYAAELVAWNATVVAAYWVILIVVIVAGTIWSERPVNGFWKTTIAVVFLLLATAGAIAAPPAKGSEDEKLMAPYTAWFTSQHDRMGRWCCDIGDGRPVDALICSRAPKHMPPTARYPEGSDKCEGVVTEDGDHWWAHVTPKHWPGQVDRWEFVPDDRLLTGSNPTGTPVLWLYMGKVQCFAPPDAS